jgi:type IV secretion system protein VirB2
MQIYLDALRRLDWLSLLLIALVLLAATHPHAALGWAAGCGSLPWDAPLTTLKNDITGPVAFTISLLAMVACGAALVFGGEIHEFVRRIIMLVLVVSFIAGVTNLASALGHCRCGRMSLRRLPFHRVPRVRHLEGRAGRGEESRTDKHRGGGGRRARSKQGRPGAGTNAAGRATGVAYRSVGRQGAARRDFGPPVAQPAGDAPARRGRRRSIPVRRDAPDGCLCTLANMQPGTPAG